MTESLQRPFDVRPCTINIPNLGFTQESVSISLCYGTSSFVQASSESAGGKETDDGAVKKTRTPPISSSVTMYTAAQHGPITGHTGYVTSATLYCKNHVKPE